MVTEAQRRSIKKYLKSERGRRKLHEALKRYRAKLKEEVLRHYGNGEIACRECGERDIRCLSIDHIVAVGSKRQANLYMWLKKNNFPDGFQTLCMNCQWRKKHREKENPHSL